MSDFQISKKEKNIFIFGVIFKVVIVLTGSH